MKNPGCVRQASNSFICILRDKYRKEKGNFNLENLMFQSFILIVVINHVLHTLDGMYQSQICET